MKSNVFSSSDRGQLRARGMSGEQIANQIETLRRPAPHVKLRRPCTLGDGIRAVPEEDVADLMGYHQEAARQGRCLKFVPASGAATRMFKVLLWFHALESPPGPKELSSRAESGDRDCASLLTFLRELGRFAFFDELRGAMSKDGLDPEDLAGRGSYQEILEYLLTPSGLDYGNLPKGLLKFHHYPKETRTPFEEQLVEAAAYVRDAHNLCRLHFTVSPEHIGHFEDLWRDVRPRYEERYGVQYQVEFSVQKPSTDTIAVDLDNRPFRTADGALLFRPGGHGALIENLRELRGDIVFIKNIDNVVPDRLKPLTYHWKQVLAGQLVRMQRKVFSLLEGLAEGPREEAFLKAAVAFARDKLSIHVPERLAAESGDRIRTFLFDRLNRPLRVCGVVKNVKEPGGGPFWVEDQEGGLTIQIVESAQVDHGSPQQERIWASATHFNPVDIVCGVRDYRGEPFDLRQYVDVNAVFISRKSREGRELKALELPGLWNGAMAHWNTALIEVPLQTFNPVKTVFDLLREAHQP